MNFTYVILLGLKLRNAAVDYCEQCKYFLIVVRHSLIINNMSSYTDAHPTAFSSMGFPVSNATRMSVCLVSILVDHHHIDSFTSNFVVGKILLEKHIRIYVKYMGLE